MLRVSLLYPAYVHHAHMYISSSTGIYICISRSLIDAEVPQFNRLWAITACRKTSVTTQIFFSGLLLVTCRSSLVARRPLVYLKSLCAHSCIFLHFSHHGHRPQRDNPPPLQILHLSLERTPHLSAPLTQTLRLSPSLALLKTLTPFLSPMVLLPFASTSAPSPSHPGLRT
jgi:hypothetical protein